MAKCIHLKDFVSLGIFPSISVQFLVFMKFDSKQKMLVQIRNLNISWAIKMIDIIFKLSQKLSIVTKLIVRSVSIA